MKLKIGVLAGAIVCAVVVVLALRHYVTAQKQLAGVARAAPALGSDQSSTPVVKEDVSTASERPEQFNARMNASLNDPTIDQDLIDTLLGTGDWKKRNYAVQHLALRWETRGNKKALQAVLASLKDRDQRISATALHNLARVATTAPDPEVSQAIRASLDCWLTDGSDPILTETAARCAGELGETARIAALSSLTVPSAPVAVRVAAVDALAQMKSIESVSLAQGLLADGCAPSSGVSLLVVWWL